MTKGWVWDVPYCLACRKHIRAVEGISLVALFLIGASGIVAVYAAVITTLWLIGLEVMGLSLIGTFAIAFGLLQVVRRSAGRNCCRMGRSVSYLGAVGPCHTFDFKSRFYAADFVRANHRKLVNVTSEVASILKGTKFGEHQVPYRVIKK